MLKRFLLVHVLLLLAAPAGAQDVPRDVSVYRDIQCAFLEDDGELAFVNYIYQLSDDSNDALLVSRGASIYVRGTWNEAAVYLFEPVIAGGVNTWEIVRRGDKAPDGRLYWSAVSIDSRNIRRSGVCQRATDEFNHRPITDLLEAVPIMLKERDR